MYHIYFLLYLRFTTVQYVLTIYNGHQLTVTNIIHCMFMSMNNKKPLLDLVE